MGFKAQVLIADPPWEFDDELKAMRDGTDRSAVSQYPVLNLEEIAKLDVRQCVDSSGCVLALWCPSVLIPEGLRVMSSWGFNFKGTYVWVKSKKTESALEKIGHTKDLNDILGFGMGRLFRQTHEVALIGTTGKVYAGLANKSQRSVCVAENKGHSIKPDSLHESLELMFPTAQRLELFARRSKDGWTCVGNEVCEGEDIRDSLKRLASE